MEFYEHLSEAMEHLSKRGAFLTVKNNDGTTNTMTISWGYVGFSWEKPFFVTLVRPQRFTHDVLEDADSFTISIPFDKSMHKALAICGSTSGRDTDKVQEAGIRYAASQKVAAPIVEDCTIYYECAITYQDSLKVDRLPQDLQDKCYIGDSHDLYYGEIVAAYYREK